MSNLSATASVIKAANANLVIQCQVVIAEPVVEPVSYIVAVDIVAVNFEVSTLSAGFHGVVRRKIPESLAA